MPIPNNVIATADDFGLSNSVNKAVLYSYEQGIINSTSLLTNTAGFKEAAEFINQYSCIKNVGIHINLAEGKPLTNMSRTFLDNNGQWDTAKINSKLNLYTKQMSIAFEKEIHAQINKARANNILLTHIDSHYHLHTLPGFYKLFIKTAKHFNLKLRLAQTFRENSYIKFLYRQYINYIIKKSKLNYSDNFQTVAHFLTIINNGRKPNGNIEIMLHPDLDQTGKLTDHFDKDTMRNWLMFLKA
ncbi:ChbG/HpnK family deacetylase [Mucilaginibacter segetis]|uniref:ChbG/HpnK family deacetylase n=1 Tax=Mucilaginibacter segetis TaxID=2793071 RepID=A0A934PX39_9SPHI|nr:ChbG/HpnK family deacetylase [Mucilaginibacter segetis]MBK0380696.1 ChbG/HpnK family deacetylase [Mucilaginibacter segetis]